MGPQKARPHNSALYVKKYIMKYTKETNETPFEWWGRHRARYNFALILAGIGAFICFVVIFEIFKHKMGPEDEITVFTIAFQGAAYLIAIGLANICYFIGPVSEKIIKPKDVHRYRRNSYRMGFWGSFVLPFSVPIIMLIACLLK